MTITQTQQEQMLEAAKPLIKWLNENCHPHCAAQVDQNTVTLTEDVASHHVTDKFEGD